jgi:hypothetical protein
MDYNKGLEPGFDGRQGRWQPLPTLEYLPQQKPTPN